MKNKLELKNFELVKVKKNAKGGLDVSYYEKDNNNELFSVESDNAVHPDFSAKLDEFKELFASSLGILQGWDFARENNRKNDEKLAEAVRCYKEEINRVSVSGLVLVGKDQYLGVKVTGSLKCVSGNVGLSSPNIRFESDNVGVEENAESLFYELQQEVFMYVFKSKKAQQDLLDQIDVVYEEQEGLNTMKIAQ